MATVGAFLKEKLVNMARWVTSEVGKENLPVDLVCSAQAASELQVTMFAAVIKAHAPHAARDWQLLEEISELDSTKALVRCIRSRPDMHDKFWRYIALFNDCVV